MYAELAQRWRRATEHRELQPSLDCITDWGAERENPGLHCSMACAKDACAVARGAAVCPAGNTRERTELRTYLSY
jgi:hypothetical protein